MIKNNSLTIILSASIVCTQSHCTVQVKRGVKIEDLFEIGEEAEQMMVGCKEKQRHGKGRAGAGHVLSSLTKDLPFPSPRFTKVPRRRGWETDGENESFMFYMLNNKSKPYSSSEGNFSGALCLAPKSPEDQPVLFGTIFPITAKEVEYVAISRIWTKCRIRMSQPSAGQFSPALVSCPCLMSGITITWISGTAALTQCTTFLHNV